jgi:hypothetical protein
MGPFTPGTAREIPDPQVEVERLAAKRAGIAPVVVLGAGDVITVHVKTGQVLTGRIVAVDPEPVGDGRYAFKVLAEPLD